MIIVRGNTLPNYAILSQNASGWNIDGYQHHEKWQYQPIMGVNVDEVKGEAVDALTVDDLEKFRADYRGLFLSPSIFNLFQSFDNGDTVVINTLTETIAVLDDGEVSEIREQMVGPETPIVVLRLFVLGLLARSDDDELFKLEVARSKSAYASSDAINFIIYPTTGCNARCYYCFEEGVPTSTMNKETVNRTVRYILANVAKGDEVVFRWFGGEPLVAHKTITEICQRVGSIWGDDVEFNSNVTTNGLAITDELIKTAVDVWHAKKFHLTIDGYGHEHDIRKNYYDKGIDSYKKLLDDIEKLIDAGIFVVCRLNLDKKNLPMIDDILSDLERYKDSGLFYVHNTTLRCPASGDPGDYILHSDFSWAYEYIFRAMFEHGFYDDVKHILPLRLRGNCLARVMNEVIIGADGNLYKCEQYPTLPEYSVGNVKTGIVFNDAYKSWIDPSIERSKCKNCAYLPLCAGGCKQYWDADRPDVISPCVREKSYMGLIATMVHEWATEGRIKPRDKRI